MPPSAMPIILEYLTAGPWAMVEGTLSRMTDVVLRHVEGVKLSPEEIDAVTAARGLRRAQSSGGRDDDARLYEIRDGVAVIPISGVIAKHARLVNGASSPRGTSIEQLAAQLREAMEDERVGAILLHIESPGGSVAGLADFADAVYEAGGTKPVVTFAEDLAASAAYWIGSQATEFLANQTADVGSIGVYTVCLDDSREEKARGRDYQIIRSGQHKGVGSLGIPITEENLRQIQTNIDSFFEVFTAAVLRGRAGKISAEQLAPIADGRLFVGNEAVEAGLVDGITTLAGAMERAGVLAANPSAATNKTTAAMRNNQPSPRAEDAKDSRLTGKDLTMAKDKTDQVPAADQEETQKAVEKALADERTRVAAVTKILGDYPDLLATATADPQCGQEKATAMLVPALQGKIEAQTTELKEANDRLAAYAAAGGKAVEIKAADAEKEPNEDKAAGGDDGKAETYQKAVDEAIAAKVGASKAHSDAATKLPKSFVTWTAAQQPKK